MHPVDRSPVAQQQVKICMFAHQRTADSLEAGTRIHSLQAILRVGENVTNR